MFRICYINIIIILCFPHARGDVPLDRNYISGFDYVFPTPVGMFRILKDLLRYSRRFPHARGDVPSTRDAAAMREAFSPRPWGCSARLLAKQERRGVFPTPVGMFLVETHDVDELRSFPHARGDVPTGADTPSIHPAFSPRPWGCSETLKIKFSTSAVFPTPVGMFRGATR